MARRVALETGVEEAGRSARPGPADPISNFLTSFLLHALIGRPARGWFGRPRRGLVVDGGRSSAAIADGYDELSTSGGKLVSLRSLARLLGGLMPDLLCSASELTHSGTTDVDVQVNLEIAAGASNAARLERALRNAECEPDARRIWRGRTAEDDGVAVVKFELLADTVMPESR